MPDFLNVPDLLALADELMTNDRALSRDQALDAAAMLQAELADYAAGWETHVASEWIALQVTARAYAADWDADARSAMQGRS